LLLLRTAPGCVGGGEEKELLEILTLSDDVGETER